MKRVLNTLLAPILCLLIAAELFSIPVHAQTASDPVYHVIGTGIIHGGNKEVARNQAISNSLISAVERAISENLSQEILVENFQSINERFLENTGLYVRNYKVLTDLTTEMDYRALIQVTVMIDKLRQDLQSTGFYADGRALPKVIFLIAEKRLMDFLPSYWWGDEPSFVLAVSESAMASFLKEKGFEVIDHKGMELYSESFYGASDASKTTEPETSSEEQQEASVFVTNWNLNNLDALKIGRKLGAQVLIVGTANAEIIPSTMGETVQSFRGSVAVRVLIADNGQEIMATNQTAVAVNADEIKGGDDALAKAGTLAAAEITEKLSTFWQKAERRLALITVDVQGTGKLGHFVSFRRSVTYLPGVGKVKIKEITPRNTRLAVEYEGTSKDLANELMALSFDAFGINIFDIQDQQFSVELVPIENITRFE
jgi:hypothetical protein